MTWVNELSRWNREEGALRARLRRLDPVIREAVAKMLASPPPSGSLAELAADLGRSPSHFQATFAQQVGMPAEAFLSRRRILYTCRVLSDDPWERLDGIAHVLGYSDGSCLSRLFRRSLGVAPSRVRWTFRGDENCRSCVL